MNIQTSSRTFREGEWSRADRKINHRLDGGGFCLISKRISFCLAVFLFVFGKFDVLLSVLDDHLRDESILVGVDTGN